VFDRRGGPSVLRSPESTLEQWYSTWVPGAISGPSQGPYEMLVAGCPSPPQRNTHPHALSVSLDYEYAGSVQIRNSVVKINIP